MKECRSAGIDIGSVSIALVLLDHGRAVAYKDYRPHNGKIYAVLEEMLGSLPVRKLASFGVIAEKGREFFTSGIEVNEQVAIIAGVKNVCPEARSIITIGGETFGLILFDGNGRYKKYISNSACAAGTGSFLDQQASRLGLRGSTELSALAEKYHGEPPKIATRCAVFAKTDLVHMQQQGYDLPAIAAGLCHGVAQNICDTLFHSIEILQPVLAVGGVSKNKKVVQYLEEALNQPLTIFPDSEYAGAIGAALSAAENQPVQDSEPLIEVSSLLSGAMVSRSYFYPPLAEGKTSLTDFSSWQSFISNDVEIDIYEKLESQMAIDCYLGLDIGSTSTKAILMGMDKRVLAGFYTRTMSQPIPAVQKLTRALKEIEKRLSVKFSITGTGTTGSGRKFIQRVTRADFAVDEITAHARAAYHLNPDIDTIIEIGGQDAKFTVMQKGNVTFSVMNYVCAAGTGSFIEEQARRLGVDLKYYSGLAMNAPAPLISDRCTVFMERDLNHMLSLGYSREELLAAALHSVRDNYLSKVAHVNKIGSHIAFQGATAKNHALVMAFEQKLRKPIYVSKFCHLTGALGVCLKMADAGLSLDSRFRRDLHKEQIVVDEYVCDYCKNHCKINSIVLDDETLGWGYMCGRVEHDIEYRKKEVSGFDLLRNHRRVFDVSGKSSSHYEHADVSIFGEFQKGGIRAVIRRPEFSLSRLRNRIQFNAIEIRNELFSSGIVQRHQNGESTSQIKIGLPSTLNMIEYLPLWQLFFKSLGFTFIVSTADTSRISEGKEISGAEYCAPLTEFHGHVRELEGEADFIFYPQLFENTTQMPDNKQEEEPKSYCYYSSYAIPIIRSIPGFDLEGKLIAPVLKMNGNIDETIRELYLSFPEEMKERTSFNLVEEAFQLAWDWFRERRADLRDLFRSQLGASNDIGIVLMGRPYLVLNNALNKKIPDKLAGMGIQSFSMDMVPVEEERLDLAKDFLRFNHWYYGNLIIRTAEIVAQTPGLFPIYLTAFKCSPDSFIISYFREIMDYYGKPYLILQIDDHEAGEGYDTRLEAAIETFRNYSVSNLKAKRPVIRLKKTFEKKTYLIPSYDPLSGRLIQGALINAGIDSMLIEETPEIFQRSLRINDGQCLPVSIMALGIQHTIKKHGLDPAKTALFSNTESQVSCNLPQYPVMIKKMLERLSGGMEKVDVLVSRFPPTDLSIELVYEIYMSYLIAGLVQKITHKIRPREKHDGMTDRIYRKSLDKLFDCFAGGASKEDVFKAIVDDFLNVEIERSSLPGVGVVGDLYVRDNDTFNQGLIRVLEKAGAEAVTVPLVDSINLVVGNHFKIQWTRGWYFELLRDKVAYNTLQLFSKKIISIAAPILQNGTCQLKRDPLEYLIKYGFNVRHGGETAENLLKAYYLYENCSDLKFIVNVNPIFCCPGLISEAIYKKVEKDIGIPIVSITYDGTTSDKNRVLRPYLHFLK
ncbi:MAG: hypothetical protein HZA77_09945 [Candidatus Schekmanbacteria bacterium]|nr:hypothetical protein [Candidatus Schekmanbacteria bacterium]